jgi:hypothetical protein
MPVLHTGMLLLFIVFSGAEIADVKSESRVSQNHHPQTTSDLRFFFPSGPPQIWGQGILFIHK